LTEEILISLVSILVLGIGAQWIAWRINLPSILLLLIFGFIAGPVTGLIDPDILLGDLLLPVVSVSVAVILFEGGLSLRVSELPEIGGVIRNLMSIGLIVTWFISAAAAHFVLNLDIVLAVLFGAIIVVTGPTVIVPLLRYVQPTGQVGPVLRWEGILIDPVGAMLAVLVFEAIIFGEFKNVWTLFVSGIFKTIVIGGAAGACGAGVMVYLMKKHWIPDFLQSSVTLMTVATFFALSNLLETDSGLLSVTIMGIVLANQNRVTVKHIAEFKENLRVLLISSLFILLAARMNLDALDYININTFLFLCVLIFVARPLAVYLSTIASNFNWREKLFLSWFAPRGIVAAAVSSIFALRLSEISQQRVWQDSPLSAAIFYRNVLLTKSILRVSADFYHSHLTTRLILLLHYDLQRYSTAPRYINFPPMMLKTIPKNQSPNTCREDIYSVPRLPFVISPPVSPLVQ
jgi:NhaP-type Na+/H+ or K+/H+ antiporter